MTATYAFTNYHAQGQTIPTMLVDIATPPTEGLNLFNLYVALSWMELLAEDDRLEEPNKKTLAWWKDMKHDIRSK
ncbi:hypothetical protein HD554DRAFT_2190132 [Boletus coccyginus]|nr:hypothetical protein HD554DRAFT_2190132 [Boletus coccyginus]